MSEEKKTTKPKVSPKVWKFYKIEGNTATRLRRECPRDGKGYFLAEHGDRATCGHCGYTIFKKSS